MIACIREEKCQSQALKVTQKIRGYVEGESSKIPGSSGTKSNVETSATLLF